MAKKERNSILDYIKKSSGYDIALMTTFNFEINYFERAIMSQFAAHNVRTVSLFVDADELAVALREVNSSFIGRRYMVNPVKLKGAFHPKVILLLAEKKATLIVSSANIKTSGYTINNELFGIVTYDKNHPEYLDVICDAIDFFLELDKMSYHLDSEVMEDIRCLSYYRKAPKNSNLSYIHNLKRPISEQFADIIHDKISAISIAVPYYDKTLGALSELKSVFPNAKASLFIQNTTSTFPKDYNAINSIADSLFVFDSFYDNDSAAFYHGKTFLFKGEDADYILYGSANCTQAALTKTPSSGGNVECCLLAKGEKGGFDYFFENMKPTEKEFAVNSVDFDLSGKPSIYFKYCEIQNGIFLHFSSAKGVAPDIFINESKLEYSIKDGDIIVYLPEAIASELGELFDVTFKYADIIETIRCWVYNPEALKAYRSRTVNTGGLDSFEFDSKDDKYLQDRINYLNAEQTCLPEVEAHMKELAYYNQIKREQEEGAGDDNDYIIEVEIPEDYNFKYRTYQKVDMIRHQILGRLFGRYRFLFGEETNDKKNTTSPVDGDEDPENPTEQKRRLPTTDEKRFNRFIRTKISGMLDPKYISIIEPKHLLTLVQVIMDIFSKYRYVDLFDDFFVIESRVSLYKMILSKDFSDCDDEKLEYMILLECYKSLAENYFLIASDKDMDRKDRLDSVNRELLVAMDRKYDIRSIYTEHIRDLMKAEDPAIKKVYEDIFSNYIENLFGYKNFELLEKYIASKYDEVTINISGKQMVIEGSTKNIKQKLTLDRNLIKVIRDYSSIYKKLDSVLIIVHNANTDTGSAIDRVEHEYNYRSHNWSCTTAFKNGVVWPPGKPEFIGI